MDPHHPPFAGILSLFRWDLPRVYSYTKFEVSSFTRFKDTAQVPCNMAGCARGCDQSNAWISVVFYPTPLNLVSI